MKKAMRITGIAVAIVILIVSLALWVWSAKPGPKVSHGQSTPYEHAMSEKKPFIMMFHSQWCSSCHQFMPSFQDLSEEYENKYNFVLVDIDDPNSKYVVDDYMPSVIPMIYIVDPTIDNRILINSVLLSYPQKLRAELDRYLRVRALIKK